SVPPQCRRIRRVVQVPRRVATLDESALNGRYCSGMNMPERSRSESGARILSDLALVVAAATGCALLAIHFQWSEWLFAWTRRSESFELDELALVLLSFAVGLAWFSWRRWRGTRHELEARLTIQARLAQTLEEQRRLAQQFVELQERE